MKYIVLAVIAFISFIWGFHEGWSRRGVEVRDRIADAKSLSRLVKQMADANPRRYYYVAEKNLLIEFSNDPETGEPWLSKLHALPGDAPR